MQLCRQEAALIPNKLLGHELAPALHFLGREALIGLPKGHNTP